MKEGNKVLIQRGREGRGRDIVSRDREEAEGRLARTPKGRSKEPVDVLGGTRRRRREETR